MRNINLFKEACRLRNNGADYLEIVDVLLKSPERRNLGLKEITLLADKDEQVQTAFQAYLSDVKKAVYAISSSFSSKEKISEILLAGRGAEIPYLREKIKSSLNGLAPVKLMKSYSQIAKRSAQGAAFIANGLLNGQFAHELRFLTVMPLFIKLHASVKTLVALATLRAPDVTRKISTLSFFAVLFSSPKYVSTILGSMLCFSQKNFL